MAGFWDYAEGLALGSSVARIEGQRAVNETARRWAQHVNELEERLSLAEQEHLFMEARLVARDAYINRLLEELARVAPKSDVIVHKDAVWRAVSGSAVIKFMAKHGYHYDIETCTITRIKEK